MRRHAYLAASADPPNRRSHNSAGTQRRAGSCSRVIGVELGPVKTEYSRLEKLINTLAFPWRAVAQNPNQSTDHLMCLRDERMYHVKRHCRGRVLDVGCGPWNVFCEHFCEGQCVGIDFFAYPGLDATQIIDPPLPLPFEDGEFDTVTLIANVNHIPRPLFPAEMIEIARVLRTGGRVVMTRIGLLVSFLTHQVVGLQAKLSPAYYSLDHERGMGEDERYTVSRREITSAAMNAGLRFMARHSFPTQWFLNEVLIYEKA